VLPSVQPSPSPSPSASAGQLTVDPTSLTFSDPNADSQQFRIHEPGFIGLYNVDASACSGVAEISPPPYVGPNSDITVMPNGAGSCTINVTNGLGGSTSESITVNAGGHALNNNQGSINLHHPTMLKVSMQTVSLLADGEPQAVSVSEAGYARILTATSSDNSVATISPGGAVGPQAIFAVSPHRAGVALIRIADEHANVETIYVLVRANRRPLR